MKIVLIVEHDAAERRLYTDALRRYHASFEVLSAADGREALGLLESCDVDLLVAELAAPDGAALELLATLQRHYPKVGALLRVPAATAPGQAPPNVALLEPPVTPPALAEAIHAALERPRRGVTLADLLAVLGRARRTCALRVEAEGQRGTLYLAKGELVEARLGEARGQAAREAILGWANPQAYLDGEALLEPASPAPLPAARQPAANPAAARAKEKPMSDLREALETEAEKLVDALRQLQARAQAADEALTAVLSEAEALRERQRSHQQAQEAYRERQERLEQLRQGAEQLAQQLLSVVKQVDEESPAPAPPAR